MNKRQTVIMWIGIGVFLLIGLHPHEPPRIARILSERRTQITRERPTLRWGWQRKNVHTLFCYWISVAVVTGGLIYTFKDKKPKDSQKQ